MRRSALLLATMGLALLLASGVALGATRIVTKTFSNTSQIQILDATVEFGPKPADPYPSEINVSGFRRGSVRDVNLVFKGYTHTFPEDVGVLLVGPRGQKILVMSDVGGKFFDVFGVNLTLDEEAESPLPSSTSFISGTY